MGYFPIHVATMVHNRVFTLSVFETKLSDQIKWISMASLNSKAFPLMIRFYKIFLSFIFGMKIADMVVHHKYKCTMYYCVLKQYRLHNSEALEYRILVH